MSSCKLAIVIQARTGSTRLPEKVLANIGRHTLLDWTIHRCRQNRRIREVVLATSDLDRDKRVAHIGEQLGVSVVRGSEIDVTERFMGVAQALSLDSLIRITADCPFVDPDVIDRVVDEYEKEPADYLCIGGYPEGLGSVELISTSALVATMEQTRPLDLYYREHVVTYVLEHLKDFRVRIVPGHLDHIRTDLRFSIDTPTDLARARRIAAWFDPSRDFRTSDLLTWVEEHEPEPIHGIDT